MKNFVFGVFLLWSVSVLGQEQDFLVEPTYTVYGVDEGLPSSEAYHVFEDVKGYIWIATDRGICQFNGSTIKTYNAKDGLTDNVIFKFYEDYRNRIWCSTHNNKFFYLDPFDHYKPVPYPYNHLFEETPPGATGSELYMDREENLWVGFKYKSISHITKEGKKVEHSQPGKTHRKIINVDNHLITTFVKQSDDNPPQGLIIYENEDQEKRIEVPDPPVAFSGANSLIRKNGDLLTTASRNLYIINDLKNERIIFPSRIIYIYEDKQENLFVGTYKGGVFILKKDGQREHFFRHYSITSTLQDSEGGFWFSTLENGVLYVPNLNIRSAYPQTLDKKAKISTITGTDSLVVFSTENGRFYGYTPDLSKSLFRHQANSLGSKTYAKTFNDSIFLSNYVESVPAMELPASIFIIPWALTIHPFKGNWYLGNIGKLIRTSDPFSFQDRTEIADGIRVNDLAVLGGRLYLATKKGLYYLDENEVPVKFPYQELPESFRSTVLASNQTLMLAGTIGAGLFLLNDSSVIQHFSSDDHLSSDIISSLAFENEEDFWVGTGNGVDFLFLDEDKNYASKRMDRSTGLISNEVTALYNTDSLIYIATRSGITMVPKDYSVFNSHVPRLFFTQISGLNSPENYLTDHPMGIDVSHRMDNVQFTFESIGFKNQEKEYRYRLTNFDRDWLYTSNREVFYSRLPPGEYNFEVMVRYQGGNWSDPLSYSIRIARPFWQEGWFYLSALAGTILIITVIVLLVIRRIKAREQMKHQIISLKAEALKAQMNPHFVFNCLNSIQRQISDNDRMKAQSYLAKFARLIRVIFEYSAKDLVSLKEELDVAKLYLDLEKIRFKEDLEYEIIVEKEIEPFSLMIPALLIQPFIENAIIHGIAHSDRPGKIRIEVVRAGNHLHITVEDNGIGVEKSREFRKEGQKSSRGIAMARERLEVLSKKYPGTSSVALETLKNEDGLVTGTKIAIVLYKIQLHDLRDH